jgi:hypothetical protein
MIQFKADQSSDWRGLYFEEDGKQVTLERALREGFKIEAEDTPMVCTLLKQRFSPNHNYDESCA